MRDDIITFGGPGRLSRRDAEESIEALFHEHYPRIVYTALTLVGVWGLAEDLALAAYLRLWRRWRWISDPRLAPLYLQRTVVSLSRESFRRKMIGRRALTSKDMVYGTAPQPDSSPMAELRRAIAGLPMRRRELVVLRYLIGLSETETAGLLGISVGTVKRQTRKGFRQLRDTFESAAGQSQSGKEAGTGGAVPGEPGERPWDACNMTDADLQRRLGHMWLTDMPAALAQRQIDTKKRWKEFQRALSRSTAKRRRALSVAAVAVVAVGVFTFPALSGRGHLDTHPQQTAVSGHLRVAPHNYPGAVAARIQMSGVTTVVGDTANVWVVRAIVPPPGLRTTYQLAGINLKTNMIMFRTSLYGQQRAIAAGSGRLWLTTAHGQARGQIVRLDPADGHIISTIRLHAGVCTQLAFGFGHLFAACRDVSSPGTAIWRINPVSEQGYRLTSPVRGFVSSLVAAPQTLWYLINDSSIRGLANVGGNPQPLTAQDRSYYQTMPSGQGLVYGDGSLWALSGGERLAKIDPSTGRVLRRFSFRNYDPSRAGGLDFLTAGGGWLWFLDNGYPFSGVLRVSEATGRPAGGVSIAPASCGQVICSQIFHTPGAVWVPTAALLIRIDTSRMPG
ncbi:MAG: sigma-70 family RNA polymerase sigma factor [Streptosporangiaceae bacterium]